MTSFSSSRSSASKSYFISLTSLTASTFQSSITHNVDANDDDIGPSDDADALRWKLYGKNEEFRIMHDAATTIQSFWRGCFSRTTTSAKIQTLIEDIMASRELEAEYKKRDEEEHQIQQQQYVQNYDHDPEEDNGNNDDKHDSCLTGHLGLARRNIKKKPWRMLTEDNDCDDCDDRIITLVTSSRKVSSVREEEEESWTTNHISDLLESADDDNRGYRRYRTNIHGKNKTRPWRDDTSVFDAY